MKVSGLSSALDLFLGIVAGVERNLKLKSGGAVQS